MYMSKFLILMVIVTLGSVLIVWLLGINKKVSMRFLYKK